MVLLSLGAINIILLTVQTTKKMYTVSHSELFMYIFGYVIIFFHFVLENTFL